MLLNFILYIIVFQIEFILIINRKYKIINNRLVIIPKKFWEIIKNNILKLIIDKSRTKIYLYNYFKKKFHKSILISKKKKRGFWILCLKKQIYILEKEI